MKNIRKKVAVMLVCMIFMSTLTLYARPSGGGVETDIATILLDELDDAITPEYNPTPLVEGQQTDNDYLVALATDFRAVFNHPLDISMLILEIDSSCVIASYGDIDSQSLAIHALWPIIATAFIDEFDIDIHEEFENNDMGPLATALAMMLYFQGVDYYTGYSTFKRAMNDGSPAILFRLAEDAGVDFLVDVAGRLGLQPFGDVQNVSAADLLIELLIETSISPRELALLYAALVSGDICIAADASLEILNSQLDVIHENWGIFSLIQDELFFDDFRTDVVGNILDYHGVETGGSWFIGLYPVTAPEFVTVIHISYDAADFNRAFINQEPVVTMPRTIVLAYEIFLYLSGLR